MIQAAQFRVLGEQNPRLEHRHGNRWARMNRTIPMLSDRQPKVDRVAGIAVKHPVLVATGRHYGLQVHACVPADPASKGGSESTVKIAKADLVPTESNLLEEYASFAELRAACDAFCDEVNAREAPRDPSAAGRSAGVRTPAASTRCPTSHTRSPSG